MKHTKTMKRAAIMGLVLVSGSLSYGGILYETGFEPQTGSPWWPTITTIEFNMSNGYDGWVGGTPDVHVVSKADAHDGVQSYKMTGWGSSQPSKTIAAQSGHDVYARFWINPADNGEFTFLQTKQSSGATMSEIKISTDADLEVSADNVWQSAGSFDVGTDWLAVQIQWLWNGSLNKYDEQTFYAANIGDTTWTTVGTHATRFDQANFATISLFKEGTQVAYIDDMVIADSMIAIPEPGGLSLIGVAAGCALFARRMRMI